VTNQLDPKVLALLFADFDLEFSHIRSELMTIAPELGHPETREDAVRKLFRHVHTLKGSARAIGLEQVAGLAHALEDCLSVARVEPRAVDQAFLDSIAMVFAFFSGFRVLDASGAIPAPSPEIANLRAILLAEFERLKGLPLEQMVPKGTTLRWGVREADDGAGEAEGAAATDVLADATEVCDFVLSKTKAEQVVKEAAAITGKKVDLFCFGSHFSAPSALVRQVDEAIMHLLRNAVDHGIEDPMVREAYFKPVVGRIMLKFSCQGDALHIQVSDDGRGLDSKKILEAAKKSGQKIPGAFDKEEEIYDLIFLPGLSTKMVATDLSGRGVGMDAVKMVVDGLGGKISISSRANRGTKFDIVLPLGRSK
jgi:chemotaxis protein histidine kinase CheA